MSEVVGYFVLLVLAIPVISIVALVMTLNARDGVRRLERRIAALEATRPGPAVVPTAEPAPAAPVQAAEPPPSLSNPWPLPKLPSRPRAAPSRVDARAGNAGGTVRHAMGRLDRRPCARARWHFPRPLHRRDGTAWSRRADIPRRDFLGALDHGRRVGAAERGRCRYRPNSKPAHSRHSHCSRHSRSLCDRLCGLRALRFPVAGLRIRSCSALWRWRHWRPRFCMARRSPDSAWSVPSSRRSSSARVRRTTGRSISISPLSWRRPSRWRACDFGDGLRSPRRRWACSGRGPAPNPTTSRR